MVNKINEITRKLTEVSLTISRIHPEIKGRFKDLARANFFDDFGQAFTFIFEQAMEYQAMKSLFFDKLENMEDKIDSLINKQENEHTKPKRLGVRHREVKGGKNE